MTEQTTVGVVGESGADERRVALVPKAVGSLISKGLAVVVEAGAGVAALLPDEPYIEAGATIGDARAAEEVGTLRSGQTLIGFLAPRNADNQIEALTKAGVQAFALEASTTPVLRRRHHHAPRRRQKIRHRSRGRTQSPLTSVKQAKPSRRQSTCD